MYALTTLCILPINSIMNPLIYTDLLQKAYKLLIKPIVKAMCPAQRGEEAIEIIEMTNLPKSEM